MEIRSLSEVIAASNTVLSGFNQMTANLNAVSSMGAPGQAPPVPGAIVPPPPPPIPPPMALVPPPPPPPPPPLPPPPNIAAMPAAMTPPQYAPPPQPPPPGVGYAQQGYAPPPMPPPPMFQQQPMHMPAPPGPAPMTEMGAPMSSPLLPFRAFQRPGMPSPFMRPFEAQMQHQATISNLATMDQHSAMRMGATGLLGVGAGLAGPAMGGLAGGLIGGAGAVDVGMIAGGAILSPMIAQNQTLQRMTQQMFRPAIQQTIDTSRIMGASRQFVVGGQDMDITGRGLNVGASRGLMRDFNEIAEASKGQFNRRDVINIMQASGDQGLLDMAQNRQQIAESVKKISGVIGTMAQITGDPDFRNNVKLMGQMKRMGADVDDMSRIAKDVSMYSRAAGMGAPEALSMGAQLGTGAFQQQGLAGMMGAQAGVFGLGTARQAVAGGAFNNLQLATMGGEQGMAQRMAQMNAGFIGNIDAMMPYLAKRGEGGDLEIDKERLRKFRSGEMGLDEIIQQGAANANDPKMLQDLIASMQDLKNELAQDLGPQGTFVSMVEQIRRVQKQTPGLTFESAANVVTGDKQMAHQLTLMMRDPNFIQGMQQQVGAEMTQRQFTADRTELARRESETGFMAGMGRLGRGAYRATFMDEIGRGYDTVQEGVADFYTDRLERERLAGAGRELIRRPGQGAALIDQMSEEDLGAALSSPVDRGFSRAMRGGVLTPGTSDRAISAALGYTPLGGGVVGQALGFEGLTPSAREVREIRAQGLGAVERQLTGGIGPREAEILRSRRGTPTVGGMLGDAVGFGGFTDYAPPAAAANYALKLAGQSVIGDAVISAFGGDVQSGLLETRRTLEQEATAAETAMGEEEADAATRFRKRLGARKGGRKFGRALEQRVSEIVEDERVGVFGEVEALQKADVMRAAREVAEEQGLSKEETASMIADIEKDYSGAVSAMTMGGTKNVREAARASQEQGQDARNAKSADDFEYGSATATGVAENFEETFGLDIGDKADRKAIQMLAKEKDPVSAYLLTLAASSDSDAANKQANKFMEQVATEDGKLDYDKLGKLQKKWRAIQGRSKNWDPELKKAMARAGRNANVSDQALKDPKRQALKGVIDYGQSITPFVSEAFAAESLGMVESVLGMESAGDATSIQQRMGLFGQGQKAVAEETGKEQIQALFSEAGIEGDFEVSEGQSVNEAFTERLRSMSDEERGQLNKALKTRGAGGAIGRMGRVAEGKGKVGATEFGALMKAITPGGLSQTTSVVDTVVTDDQGAGMKDLANSMAEWSRLATEDFGGSVNKFDNAVSRIEKLARGDDKGVVDTLQEVLE